MKIFELFKKKEAPVVWADNTPIDMTEPECDHKWKDYDWYMRYKLTRNDHGTILMEYQIFEPYVCLKCKERKDIKLESGALALVDKDIGKTLDDIHKTYPKIKPEAIIEDEIRDDIMVDREWLKWHDYLYRNGQNPAGRIELKI